MPVYKLLLDSNLAKLQRNGHRQVSHDLQSISNRPSGWAQETTKWRWTSSSPWATRGTTSPRLPATTKFSGERKLKVGRPWFFRTECTTTPTSTVFFGPTPARWTRKTKTAITFSRCILTRGFTGSSFWCMGIMSLTWPKGGSQNCSATKKRFWQERQITLGKRSLISQEALIGCFSTAISSRGG